MAGGNVPSWMTCEDIITRMKDEIILEAIDILHDEIKAGRMDIRGYTALLPDKSNEIQKDMYMVRNLVQREEEILEKYKPYFGGKLDETDPAMVERVEELKKFVLSVQAITMLMRLSEVAGRWADDTGKYSDIKEPERIMLNTARMADERAELIDFALSNSRFGKSEALTANELGMLREVRSAMA
ncbi:MAG: hypothetical protein ACYCO0_04210 [Candidatus Micrarchaeaceae archaeon]